MSDALLRQNKTDSRLGVLARFEIMVRLGSSGRNIRHARSAHRDQLGRENL